MRNWGEMPYYKPDQNGHVWNNDYFGGDLDGIRSKLDYLKDLGVTCIYLNPIFESHENHRYNTANYRNVDPLLGTNEDFRELAQGGKGTGISRHPGRRILPHRRRQHLFQQVRTLQHARRLSVREQPVLLLVSLLGQQGVRVLVGITPAECGREQPQSYTKYICGDDGVLDYWMN